LTTSPTEPPHTDVLDTAAAGPLAIRGSMLRAGAYVAGAGMSLVSASAVARHLGVVDFGSYVLVTSLVGLAGGISDAGLAAVGVREYATRERSAADRFVRNLLGMRLALTAVTVLGIIGFAAAAGYTRTLVVGTMAGGIALMMQVYQVTVAVPLAAGLRLGWVTLTEVLRQLLTVVALVSLAFAGAGLLPFLLAAVPVAAAVLIVTVPLVRGTGPLTPAFEFGRWRQVLADVLPFATAAAIGQLYFRVALILMSLIATGVEVGYFGTSFRIMEVLTFIPGLVVSTLFPVLARAGRDDPERFRHALQRTLEMAAVIGTWMSLVVVLGAPVAIAIVIGSGGDGAIPVLRLQGFALLATWISMTCQFGLLSLRRHRELLAANALALLVGTLLVLALGPAHGAQGAAVATVSAEALLAVLVCGLVIRRAGVRLSFRTFPRVAVAALLAAACGLVPAVGAVGHVALATPVYFAVLLVLRAIPQEALQALRGA
jgi:O-antigen/teichoic acid export membrane protein